MTPSPRLIPAIHHTSDGLGRRALSRAKRVLLPMLLAVGILTVPSAAHADSVSALHNCNFNVTPSVDQTITLNTSNVYWSLFGYPSNVWTGDAIRVTATGTVNDGGWPTSTNWGPNGAGWGNLAPSGGTWPAAGLPKYSLVGSWNSNGHNFFLGADTGCVNTENVGIGANQKTFLWFFMNDENRGDNSGTWTVRIRQWFS